MKTIKILHAIFVFVFFTSVISLSAQENQEPEKQGSAAEIKTECHINKYEAEIQAYLKISRDQLVAKGILPPKEDLTRNQFATTFQWPLRQASGFLQFSYYTTTNFVDLDPTSGILDYNCGNRTYDGHNGIDISPWPFWWKGMSDEQVEVVAAAPGIIVGWINGNFDMNCSCVGSWNAVYVEHTDGSVAWYGHLKSGSLTSKGIGSSVSTGEYLGIVGSSGCSSNPHLHFEVRDANNNVIEPYAGSCNNTTTNSWWANQKPYWEPTLNHLLTHSATPGVGGFCPNTEVPNIENNFDPGDAVRYYAYYHDRQTGQSTSYNVKNPNGTIIHSWNYAPNFTASRSYEGWNYVLPANSISGVYTFNATFAGSTRTHQFYVGCPTNLNISNQIIKSNVDYQASNTVTTTGTAYVFSGSGLTNFRAGNYVNLSPGFLATSGSEFRAHIGGCQ